MSKYRVDGYYLRIDIAPDGALASLFDPDDTREEMPIAEATAATADLAVAELISTVTFDVTEEDELPASNGEVEVEAKPDDLVSWADVVSAFDLAMSAHAIYQADRASIIATAFDAVDNNT